MSLCCCCLIIEFFPLTPTGEEEEEAAFTPHVTLFKTSKGREAVVEANKCVTLIKLMWGMERERCMRGCMSCTHLCVFLCNR